MKYLAMICNSGFSKHTFSNVGCYGQLLESPQSIVWTAVIQRYLKDTAGNFASITAIIAPMILGTVGIAADYVLFFDQKSKLQEAADAAALASVKEMSLAGVSKTKTDQLQEIATAYAKSAFFGGPDAAKMEGGLSVVAEPDTETAEVAVTLKFEWAPMFAHFIDGRVTPIEVKSSAKLAGDTLTCVVGLMPPQTFAKASIHMDNKSVLKADRCSVYSNSTSSAGLRADGNAQMNAQSICSAGGVIKFGTADFSPDPITDCPKIDDPLEDRMPPSYFGCSATNLAITEDTVLDAGVYCGGLTVSNNATVTLNPGVYVIKDGPLIVSDASSFTGTGVSFFLTGPDSIFDFQADTTIDLSATESGSMAGLLFFEDRNVPYSFSFNPFTMKSSSDDFRMHRISSNDARNLLGTIYLPRSVLLVDANAPVADASAYTAIVTGRLWLREGPTLTLNADLTKTTVPVPDGIMGTEPVLTH